MKERRSVLFALGVSLWVAVSPAWSGQAIEEIIVTAQRREQALQDVPQAVSAFDAEQLSSRGVDSAKDLFTFVPNATFSSNVGNLQVSIRGMGETWSLNPSGDTAVAIYIDNVFQARPSVGDLQGMFTNLERVEVLRGPQGTLYGRNSTGGVVHLITKGPTEELEGYVNASYESYDTYRLQLGASGPVTPWLRARVDTARSDQQEGYARNLLTGEDIDKSESWRVSGQVDVDVLKDLLLKVRGDWNKSDAKPFLTYPKLKSFADVLGRVSPNRRETYENHTMENDVESKGASAEFLWNLNTTSVRSLTAYRKTQNSVTGLDDDGTDSEITFNDIFDVGEQISQEVIASSVFFEHLEVIGGVFYLNEKLEAQIPVVIASAVQDVLVIDGQTTDALGLFADATYPLTTWLSVTLGGRYNRERKASRFLECEGVTLSQRADECTASSPMLQQNALQKVGADVPTGRFVLTLLPMDDLLLFGSVSRGFRGGGFDNADAGTFDPEFLWAYEIGAKSNFIESVELNASAFYYDYTDIQVQRVTLVSSQILNAAAATSYGGELEAKVAPFDRLLIDAQASYLIAEYDEFDTIDNFSLLNEMVDLAGEKQPRSPEFSTHLGVQYSHPVPFVGGSLTGRYDWSWSDSFFFEFYNRSITQQDSYHLHHVRVTYTDEADRFSLSFFVRNLTDVEYLQAANSTGTLNIARHGLTPPRIIGAQVQIRFGNWF